MAKVLCFGELLLRFSPQLNGEWIRNHQMPVYVGGAELNVATALARWQVPVSYFTALPPHYLSAEVVASVAERGIDTGKIRYSGNRIGTYYLPQGTDMKNAGTIYDRAYSSFWELQPGQIDWDAVLEDVRWFHLSAISPALNKNTAAVCLEGMKAAAQKGITVSFDLNYRAKLWEWGIAPSDLIPKLAAWCDVIMGNIWAEEKMLGVPLGKTSFENKEKYLEQSKETSQKIQSLFPRCKAVANTFRFDEDGGVRYYATLFQNNQLFVSPERYTPTTIDKVGSGDTFMAALIYGNLQGHSPDAIIDFAAAAGFNKLFIKGDATTASIADIKNATTGYE